jgi:aminoglycoside phosphotransferase (APT) family kinase protein
MKRTIEEMNAIHQRWLVLKIGDRNEREVCRLMSGNPQEYLCKRKDDYSVMANVGPVAVPVPLDTAIGLAKRFKVQLEVMWDTELGRWVPGPEAAPKGWESV